MSGIGNTGAPGQVGQQGVQHAGAGESPPVAEGRPSVQPLARGALQALSHSTQQQLTDTADKARTWRARPMKQEAAEFSLGATAAGVGFTRFLGGAAGAISLTGAAAVALPVTSTVFAAGDIGVSVISVKQTNEKAGVWRAAKQPGGGESVDRGEWQKLKELRGLPNTQVRDDADARIKFALNPGGTDKQGNSHLSKLGEDVQKDELRRVAEYAEAKCNRKLKRKAFEGTLSTVALSFGVAALASGVITPPGLVFGAIALGFGVARGCCKLASWAKAAVKAHQGTLGQAREQNAKVVYEIARNGTGSAQDKAKQILSKLEIDTNMLENPDKREEMIVDIMLKMRS